MVGMMVRADHFLDLVGPAADLFQCRLERGNAVGAVDPRIHQCPLVTTVQEVDVDDGRPHRQRQVDEENAGPDLANFGLTHAAGPALRMTPSLSRASATPPRW